MPRQKRNTGDRNPKDRTRKRPRDESSSELEVPQKRSSGRTTPKQSPTVTAGEDKDSVRTIDSLSVARPRIWGIHHPTITNYDDVPVGWSMNEPDIHEHDIERQIQRCYIRLKEGIMPIIFEKRLNMYEEVKKRRDDMIAAEPGLSWEAVLRLESLKAIREELRESEDHTEQLPNVDALIEAYRSGKLDWSPGYVTFWSKGKQLGRAKKFDTDDFLKVNKKHNGHKGFWVEGLHGLEPSFCHVFSLALPWKTDYFQHMITFRLRIPNSTNPQNFVELEFLDDTGATNMNIFQGDLDLLHIMNAHTGDEAPGLGWEEANTAKGKLRAACVLLEASLATHGGEALIPWTPIKVRLFQGDKPPHQGAARLSGVWWRHILAVAHIPDGHGNLHLGNDYQEWIQSIPEFDIEQDAGEPRITYEPPALAPPAPPLPPPVSYNENWASGDWNPRSKKKKNNYVDAEMQTDEQSRRAMITEVTSRTAKRVRRSIRDVFKS